MATVEELVRSIKGSLPLSDLGGPVVAKWIDERYKEMVLQEAEKVERNFNQHIAVLKNGAKKLNMTVIIRFEKTSNTGLAFRKIM